MTTPLKKIPAVAAATFLILSILCSLLSYFYQQIHWGVGFGNILLSFLTMSMSYCGTAMVAISMLRGKRDTFTGVSFSLWALFIIVTNLFHGFGSSFFSLLVALFMLFLAVVCFSNGKIQLKKSSFVFLIVGGTVGFFALINMISNLSTFPADFSYYDGYWDEYYFDWAQYNYYHVIRIFQFAGGILATGYYVCIGWAFMEDRAQPRQVQYTQPVQPQYVQPQYTQPAQPQVNYQQLQELKQLMDAGIITQEEFEAQKKTLLQL